MRSAQTPLGIGVLGLAAVLGLGAAETAAQTPPEPGKPTHVVVAGPRYKAGGMHSFLMGDDYRATWTAPVRVEVLDLAGLTPKEKGGGKQTVSLQLEGPDGRRYRFRSVDKDPSGTLPEELKETAAEWVVQDQISSSHPGAALVVDGLSEAAGLLHVKHKLYVMPDDPRLGEFRQQFKGMLGMLEEKPASKSPATAGFEGVTELLETAELVERLDVDASQRVDARAFAKVRLFDILIGDWDRHGEQWEWAHRDGRWLPYATDRDLAFVHFDGLVLSMARGSHPILVTFDKKYPRILGLAWNSRVVDRRFLSELEKPAYLEAAAELQRELTDAVIEAAVKRLPPEYYALDGPSLAETLKARRDGLPGAATDFYELLAKEVEVHGTRGADVVQIERAERDDSLEVRLTAEGQGEPYFRRRFYAEDTAEVRIHLKAGDDRAASRGERAGAIQVRVIGGTGDDTVDDSQGGRTHFYDHLGNNHLVEGPGTEESDKPYEDQKDWRGYPLFDWGGRRVTLPWVDAGGDVGILLGVQTEIFDYGFRKHPWASRHHLRAGWAFGRQGFKAEYDGQFQHTNSRKRRRLFARASDVEVVSFFGFGNETQAADVSTEFYRSDQRQFLLQPAFRFGLEKVDVWVGPRAKFQTTDPTQETFLRVSQPYGVGDFGQVGATLSFTADGRNRPRLATRGVLFSVVGNYYPKAWDVEEQFGETHGEMAAYLGPIALRVGGKKVWGRYPFHEAAFLGGPETVRGLRKQRYAGDAMAFGNAELRVPLFRFTLGLPIRVGAFGLADVGRVWLENEDSETWHKGFGGGLWVSVLKPQNTVSVTLATDPDATGSDKRTRVYFQAGLAF
jgi:hypothetical protein